MKLIKKMNLKKKVYLASAILLGLTACSKSSSSSTEASTSIGFSNLAEVTGPVSSAAPSVLSMSKLGTLSYGILAASTGVSLASPGTFSSGNSVPLCENVNYLKEILREASSPDKILCYMGKMKDAGVIPSTLDIADGQIHYIKLVNLQGGGGGNTTPYVKFQLVKNGNSVSSFKMWSCFSGSSASPTQSEYISEVFNELAVTVVSKNKGSENSNSYGSSMTATGNYAGGAWSSKNINGYRYYSGSGNTNVMTLDMNQYSDRLDLSIAMNGTYGTSTYLNKFFTVAQILGADKLATLAVGNGSSKYSMSFDNSADGYGAFSESGVKSWNGDTRTNLSDATQGDYYVKANAGTIPADPNTSNTITFSGDEAWDCSVAAGASFVEADFTVGGSTIEAGMQACEGKFLGNGGQWLQCPYQ